MQIMDEESPVESTPLALHLTALLFIKMNILKISNNNNINKTKQTK